MGEAGASAATWTEKLGKSVRVAAILLASLGAAFGILLLINSQAIVGNAHTRNAHDLGVVGDIIQNWPRVYGQAAELQYDKRTPAQGDTPERTVIVHPDLGPIEIEYRDCPAPGAAKRLARPLFPAGKRAGEGPQVFASGDFTPPSGRWVCFETQIAIDRLAGLNRTAPDLSNLIIVGQDKGVLVQVGPSLPITKLPQLTPVNAFAKELAANLTQEQAKQAKSDGELPLENIGGAARIRIGDRDYFAYVQPITVQASPGLCPSAARNTGGGGAEAAAAEARADSDRLDAPVALEPCQLYAVGLMPQEVLRRAWLQPPPLILMGFGFALVLALTLLPATRLLLIGGAESVSAVEVGAMVFGVFAAASVATLAVLFSIELAGERALARNDAEVNARRLADMTSMELHELRREALRCAPLSNAPATSGDGGPTLYDAGELKGDGTPERGQLKPACSVNLLPAAVNVGARQYFKDLQRGSAYFQFGQVRAQTDGIGKTVVVLKWPNPAAATVEDAPTHRYFLAATVLRGLLAPVLPSPQRFMVVDTSDDDLPVLFHQNRARAGIETFADQLRGAEQVVRALRRLPNEGGEDRQVSFTRRYDGKITQFSAAGVSGSNWVVLVFHRVDDVDAIAAKTASRALSAWTVIALPAAVGVTLLLLFRHDAWRHLWPFRQAAPVYKAAYPRLFVGAVGVAVIGLTCGLAGLAVALVVPALGAILVFRALRGRPLDADALTEEMQRDYRWFILAMIAFLGVAPMTAFWADSRSLSRHLVDLERQEAVAHAVADRSQQINALTISQKTPVPHIRPTRDDSMTPWWWDTVEASLRPAHQAGFSQTLLQLQTPLPFAAVHRCEFEDAGKAVGKHSRPANRPWYCWAAPSVWSCRTALPASGPRPWYCRTAPPATGKTPQIGVTKRDPAIPAWLPDAPLIVLIAAALAILIYAVVYFGLRALTGFGIPTGSVSWPRLVMGYGTPDPRRNELRLGSRTLLVAPQQAVRDRICDPAEALLVNVADKLIPLGDAAFTKADGAALRLLPDWRPINGKPRRLVVCGLELVLRDPIRRHAALTYLERAVSAVAEGGGGELAGVVVIAEMSPLERILDAFDVFGRSAAPGSDLREDLRWARLFQNFTTFNFEPVDKVRNDDLDEAFPDPRSTDRLMVEELRWLPGNILDAVLSDHSSKQLLKPNDQVFPLSGDRYKAHYSQKVIAWSDSTEAATPAAAVDYIRANLVEHYEQCWAASSMAERVILDAIARNAFINMRKAVALQSLVRRGLVILDPTPRLMNRSFALYIRQAERPDTLARWRREQPRSPWALARLPLAVVLPVLVIGLAMAAAESGQELTAVFSLLAAGVPALVGTFVRTARVS